MKICHLINSYPLPTGGMQSYCYDLADRQSAQECDVHIYVSGVINESSRNKRYKIKSFKPLFNVGKATFSPSLIIALLKEKFDLFHVHLPFPFGFEIALVIAKLRKIPLVVTYHCEVSDYRGSRIRGFFMKTYSILSNFLLRFADHIIFTTEDYSKLFNFSKFKISIIPIGVDANRFQVFDKAISRKYLKLPESKFIVIFVGNLDSHNYHKKGVEYLLNAVPLIRKEISNIFINLVGKTDIETEDIIHSICKDKNISDIVRISGCVSDEDLSSHYSASNVLVLPSVSRLEAFGIVLLEAMASSLPIIASNIPGVRSVVKSSKAGFLVEPRSSSDIAKTVVSVYKLKNLDKYAVETVKNKYTWDKIVAQISEIYKNLIKI